jgi:pimeloyl-[acyl-carrier protein] methyl ester esterase
MLKEKHFYLIRGLIREKGHWQTFIPELKKCFPQSKISTIDIPGAGDHYQKKSPLTISGMIIGMREEYLRLKSPGEESHLVAISLGGMIAVEWMRQYPNDFSRVTLINTSFGGISPVFHRLIPEAFLYLLQVPLLKGQKKEAHILRLVSNHQELFDRTLAHWESIQKERPVSILNSLRQMTAAARFKIGDFIPPVPVTLLGSTHDRMVSVECSRAIAQRWKLTLKEHPTGGHDLSVDDPHWVACNLG